MVEVAEARERADENLKWNMQIIDAVSTVNGTDIMNRVPVDYRDNN